MPDLWYDVDTALSEVPVNIMPLLDDTDYKTREEGVVFNQAGLDLVWNFVTTGGAFTQTAVTPTNVGGDYDWGNQGNGMYTIEIPDAGGASINNDTEGFGWFTGYATGILPWRGPTIGFRAAAINNALIGWLRHRQRRRKRGWICSVRGRRSRKCDRQCRGKCSRLCRFCNRCCWQRDRKRGW